MPSKLLNAMMNIAKIKNNDISEMYLGRNRLNNRGDGLEYYVKDAYCNSFTTFEIEDKEKLHEQHFSYIGNDSNPPDFIVKQGEAVEVKKMESLGGRVQLNSSYPKSKLHNSDDSKITKHCRECEEEYGGWTQKDMFYSIGLIPKGSNKLKLLWFVDGECYAADNNVYKEIFDGLATAIEDSFTGTTTVTKELGKFNNVDSLGNTDLRVRPMWSIKNPSKVYQEYISYDIANDFTVISVIKKEKYEAFTDKDEFERFSIENEDYIKINYINLKNPNGTDDEIEAVVIHMVFPSLNEVDLNIDGEE